MRLGLREGATVSVGYTISQQRRNLRGLEKVRGEWAMVCTAHNLLKLAKTTG
jgi:hypothetical protein